MKRSLTLVAGTVLLLVGGALFGATPAVAAPFCTGVMTGAIGTPLEVPAGATCRLQNATVQGSVLVDPGGILVINSSLGDNTTINGHIMSNPTMGAIDTFGTINVTGSISVNGVDRHPPTDAGSFLCGLTVGGSINVSNAKPGANFVSIGGGCSNTTQITVQTSVLMKTNVTALPNFGVRVLNTRAQSLTVTNNTGQGATGGDVSGNVLSGSLLCSANSPKLTASNNAVSGSNSAAGGTC
jgi:hypothetical protein